LSSAEEPIAAVGLKPRDEHAMGHFKRFKNFFCFGIDMTHLTLFTFRHSSADLLTKQTVDASVESIV
jgi:hypothetical protein